MEIVILDGCYLRGEENELALQIVDDLQYFSDNIHKTGWVFYLFPVNSCFMACNNYLFGATKGPPN